MCNTIFPADFVVINLFLKSYNVLTSYFQYNLIIGQLPTIENEIEDGRHEPYDF